MFASRLIRGFGARPHVFINKDTKVICQGMTGNQVPFIHIGYIPHEGSNRVRHQDGRRCKPNQGWLNSSWPTNLQELQRGQGHTNCDATVIYVPPGGAAAAILEAIEAEIELIVAITEGIPIHDMVRVKRALMSQTKSRYN